MLQIMQIQVPIIGGLRYTGSRADKPGHSSDYGQECIIIRTEYRTRYRLMLNVCERGPGDTWQNSRMCTVSITA